MQLFIYLITYKISPKFPPKDQKHTRKYHRRAEGRRSLIAGFRVSGTAKVMRYEDKEIQRPRLPRPQHLRDYLARCPLHPRLASLLALQLVLLQRKERQDQGVRRRTNKEQIQGSAGPIPV